MWVGPLFLIGCSMGGTVAFDPAIEHPDRVSGLGLVGASPTGFDAHDDECAAYGTAVTAAHDAGDTKRLADLEVARLVTGRGQAPEDVNPASRCERPARCSRQSWPRC